jgi:hypothetical protein
VHRQGEDFSEVFGFNCQIFCVAYDFLSNLASDNPPQHSIMPAPTIFAFGAISVWLSTFLLLC